MRPGRCLTLLGAGRGGRRVCRRGCPAHASTLHPCRADRGGGRRPRPFARRLRGPGLHHSRPRRSVMARRRRRGSFGYGLPDAGRFGYPRPPRGWGGGARGGLSRFNRRGRTGLAAVTPRRGRLDVGGRFGTPRCGWPGIGRSPILRCTTRFRTRGPAIRSGAFARVPFPVALTGRAGWCPTPVATRRGRCAGRVLPRCAGRTVFGVVPDTVPVVAVAPSRGGSRTAAAGVRALGCLPNPLLEAPGIMRGQGRPALAHPSGDLHLGPLVGAQSEMLLIPTVTIFTDARADVDRAYHGAAYDNAWICMNVHGPIHPRAPYIEA